jgi:hypothetical protein
VWACPSSEIVNTRKRNVLETGSLSVLMCVGGTHYLLESRCLPSPHEGWETPSKGPKRAGVSLPSYEDGNRSSFQNLVSFGVYNSGREVHKPSNSECHTPSSRTFRCQDTSLQAIKDSPCHRSFAQYRYHFSCTYELSVTLRNCYTGRSICLFA